MLLPIGDPGKSKPEASPMVVEILPKIPTLYQYRRSIGGTLPNLDRPFAITQSVGLDQRMSDGRWGRCARDRDYV
jgi:hypothetical protein